MKRPKNQNKTILRVIEYMTRKIIEIDTIEGYNIEYIDFERNNVDKNNLNEKQ